MGSLARQGGELSHCVNHEKENIKALYNYTGAVAQRMAASGSIYRSSM
ncbi:protein of unknown function (plasmid) [Enterobacter cancerogenus]|nr:protein of unknown function [Enterobacter cancerogenus]